MTCLRLPFGSGSPRGTKATPPEATEPRQLSPPLFPILSRKIQLPSPCQSPMLIIIYYSPAFLLLVLPLPRPFPTVLSILLVLALFHPPSLPSSPSSYSWVKVVVFSLLTPTPLLPSHFSSSSMFIFPHCLSSHHNLLLCSFLPLLLTPLPRFHLIFPAYSSTFLTLLTSNLFLTFLRLIPPPHSMLYFTPLVPFSSYLCFSLASLLAISSFLHSLFHSCLVSLSLLTVVSLDLFPNSFQFAFHSFALLSLLPKPIS